MFWGYIMLIGGIILLVLSFSNKLLDWLFKNDHKLGLHVFRVPAVILLINGAYIAFQIHYSNST